MAFPIRLRLPRGLWAPLFAVAALLLLLRYHQVNALYPWYFLWDIDLITTADLFLMQDGRLPASYAHPAKGMYLFQLLAQDISHALGGQSVLSVEELARVPQPYWAAAESTQFLRSLAPWMCWAAALLAAAVAYAFRQGGWWALAALLLLGTQSSMIFSAASIRTEMYSVAYWLGALGVGLAAMRQHAFRGKAGLLALAGVLLGLSYMTKTQSIFLLFLFPLLLVLFPCECADGDGLNLEDPAAPVASAPWRVWLPVMHAGGNLVVLLGMFLMAIKVTIPADVQTFSTFKAVPSLLGMPLPLALAGALGGLAFLTWKRQTANWVYRGLVLANFLASGFLIAYLLIPLFFLGHLGNGLRDLAYTVKVQYFGRREANIAKEAFRLSSYFERDYLGLLTTAIRRHPAPWALHGAALGAVIGFGVARRVAVPRRWWVVFAAAEALVIAAVLLGTRNANKDDLYFQTTLNIASLFWGLTLLARLRGGENLRRAVAAVFAVAVLLASGGQALRAGRAVEVDLADDWLLMETYSKQRWMRGVFLSQGPYSEAVEGRLGERPGVASFRSAELDAMQAEARLLLPGLRPNLRTMGAAFPGFAVWTGRPEWRLGDVPPNLLAGYTIYLEPLRKGERGPVTVHSRADLTVVLFVPEAAFANAQRATEFKAVGEALTLRREGEVVTLRGLLIPAGVRVLPPEAVPEEAVVLVRPV